MGDIENFRGFVLLSESTSNSDCTRATCTGYPVPFDAFIRLLICCHPEATVDRKTRLLLGIPDTNCQSPSCILHLKK